MPHSVRIPGRRFLQSPGPSPVPDEVLHAMSRQPMDMGDPRLDAVPALGQHTDAILAELGLDAAAIHALRAAEAI